MITRSVEADGLMKRVLEAHGIHLQGLELLVPHAIPFALQGSFDRMFFTSRNAVRFFVQGGGDLHAASCDAIGSGTAEELRKHGVEAGFVGDGPDTPTIASHYVARFGPQRVLSLPDGIARVLAEHLGQVRVEDAEPPAAPAAKLVAGDICPECGQATFVYEEGCKKCYGCGFNEC